MTPFVYIIYLSSYQEGPPQAKLVRFIPFLYVDMLVYILLDFPGKCEVVCALQKERMREAVTVCGSFLTKLQTCMGHYSELKTTAQCMYHTYLATGSEDGLSLVHCGQEFLCLFKGNVLKSRMCYDSLD